MNKIVFKRVSLTLDPGTIQKAKELALINSQSVSSFIRYLVAQTYVDTMFTEQAAEIERAFASFCEAWRNPADIHLTLHDFGFQFKFRPWNTVEYDMSFAPELNGINGLQQSIPRASKGTEGSVPARVKKQNYWRIP